MVAAIVMMLVLGAVLGLGLGIADKYLKVEVDERVEKVTEMLPNYNCGGCGYAGCSGLAQALVSGEIQTNLLYEYEEEKGKEGRLVRKNELLETQKLERAGIQI